MGKIGVWRTYVCLLLVVCFVLPGMGTVVQNVGAEETLAIMVGHSVWADEESSPPYVLMAWVEEGDVYFSFALVDIFAEPLASEIFSETVGEVRDFVVEKASVSSGGVRARYAKALGHLDAALTPGSAVGRVDNLARAVVLLETLGEDALVDTLADLTEKQTWLSLLYNENKTMETAEALLLYDQGVVHMDAGRRVAAMECFVNSYKNMLFPVVGWDKVTRLSYSGVCSSPMVYWAYDSAQQKEMLHAGWTEVVDGEEHVMYARSTNSGRTWWILDASQYAEPYLVTMGVIGDITDAIRAQLIMRITQLLEKIWIIDGCHHFYVPRQREGDITGSAYVPIDDPNLIWPGGYTPIYIGDYQFWTPFCGGGGGGGGTPTPPILAPDLTITALSLGLLDTSLLGRNPVLGDAFPVIAIVKNKGNAAVVGDVELFLWDENGLAATRTFNYIGAGVSRTETFSWTPSTTLWGRRNLTAMIDPNSLVWEGDENNNIWQQEARIYDVQTDIKDIHVQDNNGAWAVSEYGMLFSDRPNRVDIRVHNIGSYEITITVGVILRYLDEDKEINPKYPNVKAIVENLEENGEREITLFIEDGILDDVVPPSPPEPPGEWERREHEWEIGGNIPRIEYNDTGSNLPEDKTFDNPVEDYNPPGEDKEVDIDKADNDPDNDGLTNAEEITKYGTDPLNPDTDGDSYIDQTGYNTMNFNDGREVAWWESHGFSIEKIRQNVNKKDVDGDGMPDGWEVHWGLLPWLNSGDDGKWGDPDGDGLENYDEYLHSTNPKNPDTDRDGLNDYSEVFTYGTDPLNPDTDGDGLLDGWEVGVGLNPKQTQDTGGIAGWSLTKALVGFGYDLGVLLAFSVDHWFDLDSIYGFTDLSKEGKLVHWQTSGFGAGFGASVHFGMLFVKIDRDWNGDGKIDRNDYPDLGSSFNIDVLCLGLSLGDTGGFSVSIPTFLGITRDSQDYVETLTVSGLEKPEKLGEYVSNLNAKV